MLGLGPCEGGNEDGEERYLLELLVLNFRREALENVRRKNWKNCLGGASFGTYPESTELWFVSVMGRSQSKQNV
jgi:hypothetical protein